MITKKTAVIFELENGPTPVGFINLYEEGDEWVKIQGCEACEKDRRKRCCGNCAMLTPDAWCSWHVENKLTSKPFYCTVLPTPDSCKKGCAITYKCIKGSKKGGFRHVTDRRGVIRIDG